MSEFDFSFDEEQVDRDIYREERQSFPGVVWHAKASADQSPGFWSVDIDSIEHLGQPEPFWKEKGVRFGDDPNAKATPSWVTRRFRCCPIGIRKRAVVKDDAGQTHYYPLYTKKENRVPGKFTAHYQIMVIVPGLTEPLVIGLKGFTKTVSWDNDPSSSYAPNGFYRGAWQSILEYTARASKQQKANIPPLCSWWVDLVPAFTDDGEPLFIKVGSTSTVYVNPFNVDLRTNQDDPKLGLDTRFVGMGDFLNFQALRKEIALPWEEEWLDAKAMAEEAASSGGSDYADDATETYEDDIDSIPF